MIRIVIENVLLLLLPTAMYVGYVLLTRTNEPDASGKKPGVLDDAPLLWLFSAGVAMVIVVLVIFGKTDGGSPEHGYVPPSFEDGKINPGKVR
jgi:hypothetical protein